MTTDPFTDLITAAAESADPIAAAVEAAKAVWQDTATIDPPMTTEERLNVLLAVNNAVLAASGRLNLPELASTPEELDDTAKWLAEKSGFPRYTEADGWHLLRGHPRDVEVAFAKAKNRVGPGEEDLLHALVTARRVLLNATQQAVGGR